MDLYSYSPRYGLVRTRKVIYNSVLSRSANLHLIPLWSMDNCHYHVLFHSIYYPFSHLFFDNMSLHTYLHTHFVLLLLLLKPVERRDGSWTSTTSFCVNSKILAVNLAVTSSKSYVRSSHEHQTCLSLCLVLQGCIL